jgi:ubiquinone/menaquinone biosynthesis C-methylase UbiE
VDAIADVYLLPLCDEVFQAFRGPAEILDAGTGTGQLPVLLARGRTGYRVTGVDLSARCVAVAREKARQAGVADRVTFLQSNLENLPLPTAGMDLVISTCSLHHWRRPERVLRELARVLKPGGELWLLDDSAEASAASRAAWVAEVERRARAGWLFRSVFRFESRCLAYSQAEVEALAAAADLRIASFELRGVFFLARLAC